LRATEFTLDCPFYHCDMCAASVGAIPAAAPFTVDEMLCACASLIGGNMVAAIVAGDDP